MIVRNARVMTCTGDGLGIIDHGAIAIASRDMRPASSTAAGGAASIAGAEIAWVGDDAQAPSGDGEVIDCGGRLVTPGLVDCHTHAIFAGSRANEFAMRARGASYHEIAQAGGGIAATLRATRGASDDELARALDDHLAAMRRGGTTTIEVKSGYDLTGDGERRLLAIAARPHVVRTLLAHVVPPERAADRDAFVREICDDWIPRARARSVDVYCDDGAFTLAESRAIWEAGKRAGLAVRGHVGQFADLGGAELLAELGGLSADHLEQVSDAGIAALARAGTVAVMLPGACVQLRMQPPPVDKLRAAGVAMAVATDLNPGTSYCETLPIQMWLACTHYGMTVDEAWLGATRVAARALDLAARGVGTIARGAPGDLVVWNASDPADIPYRYAASLVERVLTV